MSPRPATSTGGSVDVWGPACGCSAPPARVALLVLVCLLPAEQPFLTCCSSIWNGAFFLPSPFRRDGFSSGVPNTNPHFISRAHFPSTPPQAGYLQTCHPTTRVSPPVKRKEGKAPSQRIWADEPYITRAKNMQLIGREKQKTIVFKPSSETPKSDREATPPSGRCSYINNFTLVRTLHFVAS